MATSTTQKTTDLENTAPVDQRTSNSPSGFEPIKMATHVDESSDSKPLAKRVVTLGSLRHRDQHTGEIILIPTPSNDPNDPLNWSQGQKYYSAFIICLAMMMCTFLAAGPSIAISETAQDFFPDWMQTGMARPISKTAYFFTTSALLQGTGNLIWMPLVNKYGRRPVYLISYAIYIASAIWAATTTSYGSFLAARIFLGFGSGAAETMAPLSIADIFFLHERGLVMALYSCALTAGVSGGLIIAGLITIAHPWRYIYYVSIALIGGTLLLAFFTFPETVYKRDIEQLHDSSESSLDDKQDSPSSSHHNNAHAHTQPSSISIPPKKTYLQTLAVFSGTHTEESFWKLFMRPFALILLPPVLWSSLVQSVTIGFLVAVTSNVAPAYALAYGMPPWKTGLCFISAIVGALVGIFCGGYIGDKTADFFTRRNGGIREPEMRLPAIMFSLISTPLSLVLYGVGIEYSLHWMCPTVGIALLNFSIVQGTNVALVYTIDSYRPIAGEVTLTTMGFKSAFGFLLSFYTNPWIDQSGYQNAYGAMAGIAAAVIIFWIPLYIWGKRIRHATWNWSIVKYAHWDEDREVGE